MSLKPELKPDETGMGGSVGGFEGGGDPQAIRDAIIAPALAGIEGFARGGLKGKDADENLDLLGIKSLPVSYYGGGDVYSAANNRMFGYRDEYTRGAKIPVSLASARIKESLNAQAASRGMGNVSAEDALAQTRLYYEAQMKPKKDRQKAILTEMVGELPARRIAQLQDINPAQGRAALGAAVMAAVRGEDPLEWLGAPVKEAQGRLDQEWASKMEIEKLRRESLGMEYGSIDKELDDLRRAQIGEVSDINRGNREDAKQKEITDRALQQQENNQMFAIASGPTKEDRHRMADAWEMITGKQVKPEFRAQLDKEDWQERLGGVNADIAKENLDFLKQTFDARVSDTKWGAVGAKWDARTKEVEFKEAAKGLEYFDRNQAADLMMKRLRARALKQEIDMEPVKFNLNRWKSIEDVKLGWSRLSKDEQISARRQAAYDLAEYDAAESESVAIESQAAELNAQRQRITDPDKLKQWDTLHMGEVQALNSRALTIRSILDKGRPTIPQFVASQEQMAQPPPDSSGKAR